MKHLRKFNESVEHPLPVLPKISSMEYFIDFINDCFSDLIDDELLEIIVEFVGNRPFDIYFHKGIKSGLYIKNSYKIILKSKFPKLKTDKIVDLYDSTKNQLDFIKSLETGLNRFNSEFDDVEFEYSFVRSGLGDSIQLKTIIQYDKK
jgi:ferredoxin-fold anticodon binding domain-containing protein